MVSALLFRRRYLAARGARLPTSSPYFLQGTFEKIHFHRLVRQYTLERKNRISLRKMNSRERPVERLACSNLSRQ